MITRPAKRRFPVEPNLSLVPCGVRAKPLKLLERVKGIEPSYAAWEAAVLPLNYTRLGALFTACQDADAIWAAGSWLPHA